MQRLLNAKPTLLERAVVLATLKPGRGQFVWAIEQQAETLGIRVGMPLSEALSLPKRKQDQPCVEPHDPEADRLALGELASRCETFSPLVGIEENDHPDGSPSDCLLMDVTGLQHIFHNDHRLARQVISQFQVWNYYTRVAVADTVGLAWAAAHFLADSRSPAILAQHHSEAISRLPIEGLRLPSKSVDLLHQLGLYEVGQLMSIDRSSLKVRFGDEMLLQLDRFTGQAEEIIVPHRRLSQFTERWVFEYPTTDNATIEYVIQQLLQRLTAALRQQQQGVLELTCLLKLETTEALSLTVGLYEATVSEHHLFELLSLQLEILRLTAPVSDITAEARQIAPLVWRQVELFASDQRNDSRQLANLIDRLSSRLGGDCVVRPRLQADAVPERAVVDRPLAGLKSKNKSRAKSRFAPWERPLCLLPEPVPIEVIAIGTDEPPQVFFYQNRRHNMSRYWGPERIETAWWRGASIRRDYYRVEADAGHRFWLFRCLRDLRWFLHGEFS